jgi:hypothetical protein
VALEGRRLLLEHRITDAITVLQRVAAGDSTAAADLGMALYHAGRLADASPWYLKTRPDRAGFARLLSVAGNSAYGVRWPRGTSEIVVPFLQSDPLPVVEVTVNGRRRTFFIDTGASIVFLFPDVVKELGLQTFEGTMGTYAFGSAVKTDYAILDSLGLGGVTLTRLPVAVREFEGLREQFHQPDLAGALPVAVFARFLSTMDFPGGRLVLRPRAPANSSAFSARVPFLMIGDHFLVLPGRVNGGEALWFFLDTGFTAGGFLAPKRTLVRSGVAQSAGQLDASVPLTVDRLEVGPLVGQQIASRSLAFPETLETSTGFRIGGLVSKTFLAPYRVTWDFARREIVFER